MTTKSDQNQKGTGQPYLKGKNTAYVWVFVSANLAIFLALFFSKDLTQASVDQFWQRVTAKDGIVAAVIPILAIVLAGVIGDTGKARLVFWRWRNPLPGCRVFSVLLHTDSRIDVDALKAVVGTFPEDAAGQNALWYRLYKKHGSKNTVLEAHKVYLLTRELTAVSAVFAVMFSIGILVDQVELRTTALYIAALVLQYLLVATAARNYGNRFALNVLTEESHS